MIPLKLNFTLENMRWEKKTFILYKPECCGNRLILICGLCGLDKFSQLTLSRKPFKLIASAGSFGKVLLSIIVDFFSSIWNVEKNSDKSFVIALSIGFVDLFYKKCKFLKENMALWWTVKCLVLFCYQNQDLDTTWSSKFQNWILQIFRSV